MRKSLRLETDANFVSYKTKIAVRDEKIDEALGRLDRAEVWGHLVEQGVAPDVPFNEFADNLMDTNLSYRIPMLKYAREKAFENMEDWADLDLTDYGIEAETNRRLQAEYAEAKTLVEMMPSGQGAAEFVGGMAGVTADVRNVPFLLLGGGSGSLVRIMGREAAYNMAAEAAFLPSQFEMADRLEIQDPDVVETLAMAAGAGAVLGGGVELAARALRYIKGRNQVQEPLPGYSLEDTEAIIDAVEDVLVSGNPDPEVIAKIPDAFEKEPPFLLENPINPEKPPLIARPRPPQEPVAPAEPPILPPPDIEAQQGELLAAADEAERAGPKGKRPLLNAFTRRSYTAIENGQKVKKVSGMGIDPDGPVGQELKARGVTHKTAPGLFTSQERCPKHRQLCGGRVGGRFPRHLAGGRRGKRLSGRGGADQSACPRP